HLPRAGPVRWPLAGRAAYRGGHSAPPLTPGTSRRRNLRPLAQVYPVCIIHMQPVVLPRPVPPTFLTGALTDTRPGAPRWTAPASPPPLPSRSGRGSTRVTPPRPWAPTAGPPAAAVPLAGR